MFLFLGKLPGNLIRKNWEARYRLRDELEAGEKFRKACYLKPV
jgi:hypothetical protein